MQDAAHGIKSWAVFAQSDIQLAQDWYLTLGGRYTRESKWLQNRAFLRATGSGDSLNFFDTFSARPSATWSKFTPKVGLRWEMTPDQMVYLSYSSGFRSGGFNGRGSSVASSSKPYDPETVGSIEFGYKSQWLDEHLRFNANVFFSKYQDKQEEVVVPVAGGFQETLVTNAATAQLDGVELELSVIPLDGWTLRANVGYLGAKYEEFCANPHNSYITGPSCGAHGEVDLTGLELRRAPKFTGSLSSASVWHWGPGQATFNVGVRYKDDYYTTFQNTPLGLTKAASIWDSSLSYDWTEWRLSVYGHNLTDKSVRNNALYVAGLWSFASYNMVREYGAQLQYTFDNAR
jgi:iron complex outermembrane receptor protein